MLSEFTYRWKKSTKDLLKKIKYSLPDLIQGKKEDLVPPEWKNLAGDGDFRSIGNEFFEYFMKFDLIKPDSRILDVGCGIGRMAIPLMKYLNKAGVYEGFDIMKDSIKWCSKNISKECPNFRFQLARIYNKEYNPGGKIKASEYNFPFPDGYFDFAFLTSVFTHMMPEEVENYITQISRVLNSGGRCLITFFLLNEESTGLLAKGKGAISFKFQYGNYWIKDSKVPEAAIAYDENYIRGIFKKNNLIIQGPVHYGSYCGREKYLSYQDIIIAEKLGI